MAHNNFWGGSYDWLIGYMDHNDYDSFEIRVNRMECCINIDLWRYRTHNKWVTNFVNGEYANIECLEMLFRILISECM